MASILYQEYFNAFPCVYKYQNESFECPYLWVDRDMENEQVSLEDHKYFQEHNAILKEVDGLIAELDDKQFNDLIHGRAIDYMADIPGAKALLNNVKKYIKENKQDFSR